MHHKSVDANRVLQLPRSNALANARVLDIDEGLGLSGSDFNTAISVLFVGYIALQIPPNVILTRVRPSIYLASFNSTCSMYRRI